MSRRYHDPLPDGVILNSALTNVPFSQLDRALYDVASGEFNWLQRSSDPSVPPSGSWKLYFKSAGLYALDSAGSVHPLGATLETYLPRTPLSADAASITIDNIPQNKAHLWLFIEARSTKPSVTSDDLLIWINGDQTAAHYDTEFAKANGGVRQGVEYIGTQQGFQIDTALPAANSPAGYFSCFHLMLFNYRSTSAMRAVLAENFAPTNNTTTALYRHMLGGLWLNAVDPVTRLDFKAVGGNLAQATACALYGI